MSNWYQRLFLSYGPVPQDESTTTTPSQNLPGGYFEDNTPGSGNDVSETAQPLNRTRFNSHVLNEQLLKLGNVLQMVLIKPVIICLLVAIRVIAKLINIIYFREHFKSPNSNYHHTHNYDPVDKANKFIRSLEDNLPPISVTSSTSTVNDATTSNRNANITSSNASNNISTGTGNVTNQNVSHRLPPFYQGSYTQALYMATKRGKFLFVYLTNSELDGTSSMFNKVITNPNFISLFKNPNIIIWGGDLTNPESYQLANSLNVTKFPFLGLLGLTRNTTMTPEGPSKTAPKISLLVKIQGQLNSSVNGDDVIHNKFKKKLDKYEPELALIRSELSQAHMDQLFKRQQELKYQNSLAKDRLKKLQKRQATIFKKYLIEKLEFFKQLEHNQDPQQETAKIGFKMPDGERITKKFPVDLSVDDLFAYVELQRNDYFNKTFEIANPREIKDISPDDLSLFSPQYKFRLTSPLPPKIVLNDHLNQHKTIKDFSCINPNGLLIVESL